VVPDIRTVDGDASAISLYQSGDVPRIGLSNWDFPEPYGMVAIGPTGLVVTSADGTQRWFGVPSAN